MNKKTFNFELKDTMSPEEVIIESGKKIAECTNDMVICNVDVYEGQTKSYVKKNNLWAATEAFNKVEETVDIQDVLGEQSGIDNKFEVFLSVKGLEYYKYRIMFLRYGAIAYPVEVVLNEDIAEAYNGKKQYIQLATGISYKTADGKIVNCEHDAIGNMAIAFVGTSGVQMGWLASQADMLAEDWVFAE